LLQLLFQNVFGFEERSASRGIIAQRLVSNADRKILEGERTGNRRE
jgi:hypothetical protein